MAASKKKKPAAKKKPTAKKKPAGKSTKKPAAKTKAKAKKPAPKSKAKAAPKKKPAAKKPAPKGKAKQAVDDEEPTHGDAWGNAGIAPKVATPPVTHTEPPGTPDLALHDHEGNLVSPVEEEEELAERIHDGEEAIKDADTDDDSGSPRLDDREDDEDSDE